MAFLVFFSLKKNNYNSFCFTGIMLTASCLEVTLFKRSNILDLDIMWKVIYARVNKWNSHIQHEQKFHRNLVFNANHPKSCKILQGALFGKKTSTVGNWYFHLFKWCKITTWQEVQAISAEYERSTKMHGAFWRWGHVSKSALEDFFGGFGKVPSQNTYWDRVKSPIQDNMDDFHQTMTQDWNPSYRGKYRK